MYPEKAVFMYNAFESARNHLMNPYYTQRKGAAYGKLIIQRLRSLYR